MSFTNSGQDERKEIKERLERNEEVNMKKKKDVRDVIFCVDVSVCERNVIFFFTFVYFVLNGICHLFIFYFYSRQ